MTVSLTTWAPLKDIDIKILKQYQNLMPKEFFSKVY